MKKFKKLLATGLLITSLITLVGCGGSNGNASNNESSGEDNQKEEKLKVALLVPGTINDQGWSAAGYAGLKAVEKELGTEVSYVEAPTPADTKESLADYGDKGYDIVFCHDGNMSDIVAEVAGDYPETKFIKIGGKNYGANYSPVINSLEQAAYLGGIVAASLTESNVLACIGATEMPPVSKTFRAFKLGAESVNPNVNVLITYTGSSTDTNAAFEAALKANGQGADFIWANANASGLGSLKAVKEKEIMTMGWINDQTDLAPDVMIGSCVNSMDNMYISTAKEILDGTFKFNQVNFAGIKENAGDFFYNDKFNKKEISEDIKAKVKAAKQDIISGKLHVPHELE